MPTYLVERYWPGVTSELLHDALNRGRQVMQEMSDEGTRVRDLSCTLIPGEEVVFSVYEGPSVDAIRELNERAGIPVSRIAEAIWMTGDQGQLTRPSPARAMRPAGRRIARASRGVPAEFPGLVWRVRQFRAP